MKTNKTTYLLDKTKTEKIGETRFIVSSFIKADSPISFLSILKKLIEAELSA